MQERSWKMSIIGVMSTRMVRGMRETVTIVEKCIRFTKYEDEITQIKIGTVSTFYQLKACHRPKFLHTKMGDFLKYSSIDTFL